jgi:hypothetical protein
MLSVVVLLNCGNIYMICLQHTGCHYAECHYLEFHYAECHFLSIVTLSVVILTEAEMSVKMLSV